jgi:hypothetical protein
VHPRRAIVAPITILLLGCGGDSVTPPPPPEFVGLRIVAGSGATDTIDKRFEQALVVELRDEHGELIVDHPLRFTTVPVNPDQPSGAYTAYVAAPDRNEFGTFAADRTDSRGRARVLVALGRKAGPALVIITDPDHATADTATFTVQPGVAVRVLAAPEDTSLYIGRTMTLRTAVVDRAGNPRPDPVSHSASGGEITVSGSTVTAAALGTATIISTAGELADTTTVSVPPEGVLAAFTPRGLATFKTDASEFRVLLPATLNGITTAWAPSGSEIAFDRNCCFALQIVNQSGTVRNASTSTVWALYPEYSRDGRWLYYTRDGWRLARVQADGTGDELVPMTAPGSDGAPSPSPDGARVAYTHIVGSGSDRLWMLDLATGASTDLNTFGHQPAWSPSGSLIAYLALNENSAIKVMNPDGTGPRTISPAGSSYGFGHDWSPDSQWIVARNATRNRLEVLNAITGQAIPLGGTAGFNGPSWKP